MVCFDSSISRWFLRFELAMGICNSNGPPTWHLSFIVFGKSEVFFLSISFFIVCIEYAWNTGYVFSGGANTGTLLLFFSLCVAL